MKLQATVYFEAIALQYGASFGETVHAAGS